MKKIGIIFAMEEELMAFKKKMSLKEEKYLDLCFYIGEINGNQIILVVSGVGKVNAARTCQILIDKYQIDYCLNVGVAGGISDVDVLDIIIGEKLVQHDFDITAFDHPKGYIPNTGVFVQSDDYLIHIAEEALKDEKYYQGVIASGDIFLTDSKKSEEIHREFKALCVEMEGAAIAQVCYLNHIPFLVLRCISDVLGKNNLLTYEEFLENSSNKMNALLMKILKLIK